METAFAPPAVEPEIEEPDEPAAAERQELLAEELREAIRRKLAPPED